MPATAGPGEAVGFTTDDPEVAQQYLAAAYLDNRMRLPDDPGEFRLTSTRRDLGPFQLDECELRGKAAFTYTPEEKVFVTRVRSGTHLVARRGEEDISLGPGDLALAGLPGVETAASVQGIHEQVLTLLPETLAAAASQDGDGEPPAVVFTGLLPHSHEHAYMWHGTVEAVAKLLDDADARAARLIIGRTERLLAAVTLAAFPNEVRGSRRDGGARDGHPETLRRAIAFIESEPHRDITLTDIARAANVTPRSVQHAFRRHLGTTPMAYLRRVRLDHSHQQLLAASPGDGATVSRIALEWGFANPSRFAGYYREAYGRPPSKTLAE
jgi:AraC-like DNA-binding protein